MTTLKMMMMMMMMIIIAVQDQALQTKYHASKILQTETDNKCRLVTIGRGSGTHVSMANKWQQNNI